MCGGIDSAQYSLKAENGLNMTTRNARWERGILATYQHFDSRITRGNRRSDSCGNETGAHWRIGHLENIGTIE
jgi:hypothetical protein